MKNLNRGVQLEVNGAYHQFFISEPASRRPYLPQTNLVPPCPLPQTEESTNGPVSKMSQIRPNLLYVFADELRYHSCGFAGDPFAHTPNINRLSAEAANCINAASETLSTLIRSIE